ALSQQEIGDRQRTLDDHRFRLVAIGREAGVGNIQQRLVRQLRADVAQHRQAADPGVEYADRRGAKHRRFGGQGESKVDHMPLRVEKYTGWCIYQQSMKSRVMRAIFSISWGVY